MALPKLIEYLTVGVVQFVSVETGCEVNVPTSQARILSNRSKGLL